MRNSDQLKMAESHQQEKEPVIVVAKYDYNGRDSNELTFKERDSIVVIERDDSAWWLGRLEKDGLYAIFHYELSVVLYCIPLLVHRLLWSRNQTQCDRIQRSSWIFSCNVRRAAVIINQ